jgi:hypothetical protein
MPWVPFGLALTQVTSLFRQPESINCDFAKALRNEVESGLDLHRQIGSAKPSAELSEIPGIPPKNPPPWQTLTGIHYFLAFLAKRREIDFRRCSS